MKRSTRLPSQLPESLHHRLNAYALAASAAGVGVLALAEHADAKIVYTPTHHVFRKGHIYKLDLNRDGTMDFGLGIFGSGPDFVIYGASVGTVANTAVITSMTAFGGGVAAALRKGYQIPGTNSEQDALLAGPTTNSPYVGNWFNVKNRYLGLTFYINGKKHYGWARLSGRSHRHPLTISGVLTGYAYETIPNKPIIAGKTHGKDEATLGHLATGASAIPAWRVKSTVANSH